RAVQAGGNIEESGPWPVGGVLSLNPDILGRIKILPDRIKNTGRVIDGESWHHHVNQGKKIRRGRTQLVIAQPHSAGIVAVGIAKKIVLDIQRQEAVVKCIINSL